MKSPLILALIGLVSASLLVFVNDLTSKPIFQALEKVKVEALQNVFPFEFDAKDVKKVTDKNVFYEINKDDELQGIAVEVSGDKGYGGKIEILLAVSPKCEIFGYKVVAHSETPGLGDKITDPDFKKQFKGKTLNGNKWMVKKDGGFVDEITAATISSRAITETIANGLKLVSRKYPQNCN
jgi:H+/Na+-translocating ferredoxin:NAD+ oxidoreductase subunit G